MNTCRDIYDKSTCELQKPHEPEKLTVGQFSCSAWMTITKLKKNLYFSVTKNKLVKRSNFCVGRMNNTKV